MGRDTYVTRNLAKVTKRDGVEYFAVDDATLENMENTAAAMELMPFGPNYASAQFKVERLDCIKVQVHGADMRATERLLLTIERAHVAADDPRLTWQQTYDFIIGELQIWAMVADAGHKISYVDSGGENPCKDVSNLMAELDNLKTKIEEEG